MAAMRGLELRCLGTPTATVAGRAQPPVLQWRKPLGLLVYLALSPERRRTRDHLLGLFWAESPQDKAAKALNQTLFQLRRALGEERLENRDASVVLSERLLAVDALTFAELAERAPVDALALLRGEFLEGFHIDQATEFETWMARQRQRFDTLGVATLVRAGQQALQSGQPAVAARRGSEALERAPHSTPAVELRMRALALAGDPSLALEAFHEFTARLERDLSERAPPALLTLAERVRKLQSRPPRPAATVEPPLVGRTTVYRDVFDALLGALSQSPRTIVVTGAPGMGRTRVLAECQRRATMEGAVVTAVRPLDHDRDAPWSALRRLLGGLQAAPALPAAPRDALATLGPFVPDWATRFGTRASSDVGDVGDALRAVLAAIADDAPVLLVVDDAHCADGPSLAVLHGAMTRLPPTRVGLALAYATGTAELTTDLRRLAADVQRGLQGVTVRLDPLTETDLAELVRGRATWCPDDRRRARLTRRLAFETAGNPLYATTLLGALERATTLRNDLAEWPPKGGTLTTPLPFSVPSVVRFAIELRLGELNDQELAVLNAAAIGPAVLDLEIVAAVAGTTIMNVERTLPGLERRFLVEFDGEHYRFVAPMVAEAVRQTCLKRGERRRLERRAADALADRTDVHSRVLRTEFLSRLEPSAALLEASRILQREAEAAAATSLAHRVQRAIDRIQRRLADG